MTHDTRLARYFIFYVATLLFFGVGAITTLGLDWYATLVLPSWTPPELFAATAWGVLFLGAALSMAAFWEAEANHARLRLVSALYAGNAALVLLWNYLFFGIHLLEGALLAAVLVGVSALGIVLFVRKTSRTAAWFLTPYLAWMAFAVCFSYAVTVLN